MRMRSPLPKKHARIEIIPLIDIMFFLLASFMMVSLSQTHMKGIRVNLPSANTPPPPPESEKGLRLHSRNRRWPRLFRQRAGARSGCYCRSFFSFKKPIQTSRFPSAPKRWPCTGTSSLFLIASATLASRRSAIKSRPRPSRELLGQFLRRLPALRHRHQKALSSLGIRIWRATRPATTGSLARGG